MKFKEYINEKTTKKEFADALKNPNVRCGCEFEMYISDYGNGSGGSDEDEDDNYDGELDELDSNYIMSLDFPIELDSNNWEVIDDASLSSNLGGVEVVTPIMKLPELIDTIEKVFKWMDKYAYTDDTCGFHIHMSINNGKELDPLKLVLFAEEGLIYKVFPDRIDNDYATSIKKGHFRFMKPFTIDDIKMMAKKNKIDKEFNTEKYLGIHLSDLKSNHVEFRYMGGKNYQRKFNDIKMLIANYTHWLSIATDPDYKRKEYIIKMNKLVNYYNYSYLYNVVDYYRRKTQDDYIDYIKEPKLKKIAIKIASNIIKPYKSKLDSIPKVTERPPLGIKDMLMAGDIASDLFDEFKKEMSLQLEKK